MSHHTLTRDVRHGRHVRPVLAAVALLGLALPLTSPAGAAPATAERRDGPSTIAPKEGTRDVTVTSPADVEKAVVAPRSVDVSRWSYTTNPETNEFVVRIKAGNLIRPTTRDGVTTVQAVHVFVTYDKGADLEKAFALGVDSRHPLRNDGRADDEVVNPRCARAFDDASVQMDYRTDTVRLTVSLTCIPPGRRISITGNASLFVNPEKPRNPPNTRVASDRLVGLSFVRRVG